MCRVPEQGICAHNILLGSLSERFPEAPPCLPCLTLSVDRQMPLSGLCCPLDRQGHSQEPRTHNSTVARQGKTRPGL
jgi:hypothetical protein